MLPAARAKYLYTTKRKAMKKSAFILFILLGQLAATAQTAPKDSLFRLRNGSTVLLRLWRPGPRISLFTQCYYTTQTVYAATTPDGPQFPTTITTASRAWYFRKEPDGDIQRFTIRNLQRAVSDNPASLHELKVGRTGLYLGIGLLSAGAILTAAGFIQGVNRSHQAQNDYRIASDNWFKAVQTNPNAPMPPLPPHYGPSALFYIGGAMMLSALIPILPAAKHTQKALDIYNRIN
jgi:hypothetical protein